MESGVRFDWIGGDGKADRVTERTLIITKMTGKKCKVKYSFSNGGVDEHAARNYAYFQTQRYWVEKTFDDNKNELGLSYYQLRKCTG